MKKILCVALASLSINCVAADIEAGIVKSVAPKKTQTTDITSIGKNKFFVPTELSHVDGLENTTLESAAPTRNTSAVATGISMFEIAGVYSSNVGYEGYNTYTFGRTSTSYDHGGTNLFVYVWQKGYGNVNEAMLGTTRRAVGFSEHRCGSDLHVCRSGETVTGWLYGFDFSGMSGGNFEASSFSYALPQGYWSDSIYIR